MSNPKLIQPKLCDNLLICVETHPALQHATPLAMDFRRFWQAPEHESLPRSAVKTHSVTSGAKMTCLQRSKLIVFYLKGFAVPFIADCFLQPCRWAMHGFD